MDDNEHDDDNDNGDDDNDDNEDDNDDMFLGSTLPFPMWIMMLRFLDS